MSAKNSAAIRYRHFTYGVMTSAMSKAVALLVQLAVLPLALNSLGTPRYAAFLALQSFLSWTSIFGFGLGPTLPRLVATASITDNQALQRDVIMGSLVVVSGTSIALFMLLIVFGLIVPPVSLISSTGLINPHEMWNAYCVAAMIACFMLIVVMQPAIRSGYQQLHFPNGWAILASMAVAALLFAFARRPLSIAEFSLIANGPLIILMFLDLALLLYQRPYLLSGKIDFRVIKNDIIHQSGSALTVQIAFMMFAFLPTFIVSKLGSPLATAQFASVLQPMLLAMNAMNFVFQPMVSAFANAHSHTDSPWLARNYRRFLLLTVGSGIAAGIILAAAGPAIFRVWFRQDIGIDHKLCAAFACYFFFLLLSLFYFNLLSAIGELPGLGRIYLLQGLLAISLGTSLALKFGPTGMAAGLATGMAAIVAYLPVRVSRHLQCTTLC